MKKTMLLLALCTIMIGCEDTSIDYENYPICGHKYSTKANGEYTYKIYEFYKEGRCFRLSYTEDDKSYLSGLTSKYFYNMVGDSIYLYLTPSFKFNPSSEVKPSYKGRYHGTYIVMEGKIANQIK